MDAVGGSGFLKETLRSLGVEIPTSYSHCDPRKTEEGSGDPGDALEGGQWAPQTEQMEKINWAFSSVLYITTTRPSCVSALKILALTDLD